MRNKATVYEKYNKLFVYNIMTFGEWLRNKINAQNLSNAELARRVGVSSTYIGNLVRDFSPNTKSGVGRPSEEVVEKIALALGGNIDDARVAAGYAARQNTTPDFLTDIDFSVFNERDIYAIRKFIKFVAGEINQDVFRTNIKPVENDFVFIELDAEEEEKPKKKAS